MPPPSVRPATPVVETMPPVAGELEGGRLVVEVTPLRATLDVGGPGLRIDVDGAHAGHVEQQAVVAERVAGDIVSAALDRQEQAVLAGEVDRADDVGDAGRLDDQAGVLVDHPVPDGERGL